MAKFSLRNFFRRATPTPSDRKVFNMGIQERDQTYFMTTPIIFHIANQSVILRTCITQLKNEVFRRGIVWEAAFAHKCKECKNEHKKPVKECAECGSSNLTKPKKQQLEYAKSLFDCRYINTCLLYTSDAADE